MVLPSRTSRSSDGTRKERERERDPVPTNSTSSSLSRRTSTPTSSGALAPRQRPQTKGFYTDKGEFDDDEDEGE